MFFAGLAMMIVGWMAPLFFAAVLPLMFAMRGGKVPALERVFLAAIPLSIPATIYLAVIAFRTASWRAWVGIPVPAEIRAIFLPALLCSVGGSVILAYGSWRRAPSVVRAGALGIAAGFVEGLAIAAMLGWAEAV